MRVLFIKKYDSPIVEDRLLTVWQLDINGLNITVTSASPSNTGPKVKGRARGEGLEILANASLKLKAGIHYALIGRNGAGKSSESGL